MKKHFSPILLLILFSFCLLFSCTKTEVQDQLTSESALTERGNHGGHHGPHHPHHNPHHNPHNCHNPQCNVPGCHNNDCPTAVPTATGYNFDFDYSGNPGFVGIVSTINYTNDGPAGSFSMELRDANNVVDTTWIVTAPHTDPGVTGSLQFLRFVDNNYFPYTLAVEGRPANLQCPIRSTGTSYIFYNVSRQSVSH